MRAAALVPALLLALAAQPALAQLAGVDACPLGGGAGEPAYERAVGPDRDPRVRQEFLYLGADGALVAVPPGEAAMVPAPTSVPLLADGSVLWSIDVASGMALLGDAALVLRLRVCLPSAGAAPAALTVSLLRNGEVAVEADAGPTVLEAGVEQFAVPLPVDGLAFASGDNLALMVTLHTLNLEPLPSVRYLVGPNGSFLDTTVRYASLDALGHVHANSDLHAVLADYPLRGGDLGNGVWGADLRIPKDVGASHPLRVPADATRVLLQLYLDPEQDGDPSAPEQITLQLPGGPTTVYRGEVVVREIARAGGGEIRCADCGPGGQPATLATIQDVQPPPTQPGDPLEQGSTPPGPGNAGLVNGASGALVDAALERDEYGWWILVLAVPAGVMLLASIGYVMRRGGSWGEHPAPARAPPRTTSAPTRR